MVPAGTLTSPAMGWEEIKSIFEGTYNLAQEKLKKKFIITDIKSSIYFTTKIIKSEIENVAMEVMCF